MRWVWAVAVLAACAAPPSTDAGEGDTVATTTTMSAAPGAGPSEEQIGLFVANLVEAVRSPGQVEAIEADPLPFVTSGVLMCDLLAEGMTPTEVLDRFLDNFGPEPGDDDSALAGALLGSAVNVFCPEHRQALVDDLG